jgi:hypothetical protein
MKKFYWLPFALLLGVLVAPPGHAQTAPGATALAPAGTITGVVQQSTDRTPLPGERALVKGTNNGTATDANGHPHRFDASRKLPG